MNLLEAINQRVDDCVVAAWIDIRTGLVVEEYPTRSEPFVGPALDAAIEAMRSRERPPRMVLLSARHVHVIQRTTRDPNRVLVVICGRSPNLGLAVSQVRLLMEAEAA
jgi:hypothetical protein